LVKTFKSKNERKKFSSKYWRRSKLLFQLRKHHTSLTQEIQTLSPPRAAANEVQEIVVDIPKLDDHIRTYKTCKAKNKVFFKFSKYSHL